MTNETTTSILEYADTHLKFSMEDLFAYLHKKIGINKSSLAWYLFKLVNENKLVRTGRGMYARILKPSFAPQPAEEVKEVYDLQPISRSPNFASIRERLSHRCSITFHPTALFMWKRIEVQQKPFSIF